jgi:hypothetical protein
LAINNIKCKCDCFANSSRVHTKQQHNHNTDIQQLAVF